MHVLVVPSRLLSHAKIVVGEQGAVVGSANLTRSGLWRNMETVTLYTGEEAGPIHSQFWTVWEDARRNARSYIGCGATQPQTSPIPEERPAKPRPRAGGGSEAQPRPHAREGERGEEKEGDPCGSDIIDLLLESGEDDPEVERRLREYMECRAKWFLEHFEEWEKRTGIRVE